MEEEANDVGWVGNASGDGPMSALAGVMDVEETPDTLSADYGKSSAASIEPARLPAIVTGIESVSRYTDCRV